MKPILTIILALLTISYSTASCSKDDGTITSRNNIAGNENAQATKMKITIGTTVFTATLYDNPSADALIARLPLTIDMTESNGNEKYNSFPATFPANAAVGGDVKEGDLMLYGNNVLVLFYKNFNTSYSYTKLGYVDNPGGLATALGAGNVTMKFEKN